VNVNVLSTKENKVLGRKEAVVEIEHAGKPTPVRKVMLPHVAKAIGVNPDTVVIQKIFTKTGRGASKVYVFAYASADKIPLYLKEKQERRIAKTEKKVAEEKKEEKPAEKPKADEKKEEKPAEETKA